MGNVVTAFNEGEQSLPQYPLKDICCTQDFYSPIVVLLECSLSSVYYILVLPPSHAQSLAALQAYSHWLAQFYSEVHRQNSEQFISLVSTALEAIIPLISSKVSLSEWLNDALRNQIYPKTNIQASMQVGMWHSQETSFFLCGFCRLVLRTDESGKEIKFVNTVHLSTSQGHGGILCEVQWKCVIS